MNLVGLLLKMTLSLLIKRGNVYYFRWQVPPRIRKFVNRSEVVRTLKTTDLGMAIVRLQPYKKWVEKVKHITEENYDDVLRGLTAYIGSNESLVSTKASTLEAEVQNLQSWSEDYNHLLKCLNLGLELDTEETQETLFDIYRGLTLGLNSINYNYPEDKNIQKKILKDYIPLELETIRRKLSNLIPHQPPSNNFNSKSKAPDLGEFIEEFLKNRSSNKSIREETLNEYKVSVRDFEFILGKKSVDTITYEDATRFRDTLLKLPKHRNKLEHLKGLSLSELLNLENKDCLSGATVSGRLTNLRTIFTWLKARNIVNLNPFETVHLSFENQSHPDFTIEELNVIFSSELYQKDSRYFNLKTTNATYWWFPLVSLFSGARPSELIQMRVEDVKVIGGILCGMVWDDDDIPISKKTKAAMRVFPIHPELIKLGFDEFTEAMKGSGAKRIFEGIKVARRKPGDYVGKWFNDRYRRKYLPDNFYKNKKVLYSFRHTYITTALNYANMKTSAMEVMVGHKDPDNIKESTYNHKLDSYHIEKKIGDHYKEQCKLEYDGLDLTHLKGQWKLLKLRQP